MSFITYRYFSSSSGESLAWPEISVELDGSRVAIRRVACSACGNICTSHIRQLSNPFPKGGFSLNGAAQVDNRSEP